MRVVVAEDNNLLRQGLEQLLDLPTEAGRHSFVFTNVGDEPHVAALVQLEDGATIDEVLESHGETGIVVILESDLATPGDEVVITADLTPGEWHLLCPIPAPDGQTHIDHGMITSFEVS